MKNKRTPDDHTVSDQAEPAFHTPYSFFCPRGNQTDIRMAEDAFYMLRIRISRPAVDSVIEVLTVGFR